MTSMPSFVWSEIASLLRLSCSSARSIRLRTSRSGRLERTWRHWNKIGRYEQPGAWARRVLFNMALNERRHWGREQPLGDKEPDAECPPEEHLELVAALRLLSPDQRRAVVMHDALGFSVGEVANELVLEGTVKSWLSRARLKALPGAGAKPGGFGRAQGR